MFTQGGAGPSLPGRFASGSIRDGCHNGLYPSRAAKVDTAQDYYQTPPYGTPIADARLHRANVGPPFDAHVTSWRDRNQA